MVLKMPSGRNEKILEYLLVLLENLKHTVANFLLNLHHFLKNCREPP